MNVKSDIKQRAMNMMQNFDYKLQNSVTICILQKKRNEKIIMLERKVVGGKEKNHMKSKAPDLSYK